MDAIQNTAVWTYCNEKEYKSTSGNTNGSTSIHISSVGAKPVFILADLVFLLGALLNIDRAIIQVDICIMAL
jgi:hypothetical protein